MRPAYNTNRVHIIRNASIVRGKMIAISGGIPINRADSCRLLYEIINEPAAIKITTDSII
jgi:hypothetical protein